MSAGQLVLRSLDPSLLIYVWPGLLRPLVSEVKNQLGQYPLLTCLRPGKSLLEFPQASFPVDDVRICGIGTRLGFERVTAARGPFAR